MVSDIAAARHPLTTEFVVTRENSILFDRVSVCSGPIMNWGGAREQHGKFIVESPYPVPNLRGERLVISGSDGTSRAIIVTEIVDDVVFFRAGDDVDA